MGEIKMSQSEYRKRQEGDVTVFDVTPAPMKPFTFILVLGVIGELLGLSCFSSAHFVSLIFMGLCGWSIWFALKKDVRPLEHRGPSTFRVTKDSIESKGQTFKKEDITRLIIKNGITEKETGLSTGVVVQMPTAMAVGNAHRMQISLTANAVVVESMGRGYVLAGGMDETTAFGLYSEISKIMGFQKNAAMAA